MDEFKHVQSSLGNWEEETQKLLEDGKNERQVSFVTLFPQQTRIEWLPVRGTIKNSQKVMVLLLMETLMWLPQFHSLSQPSNVSIGLRSPGPNFDLALSTKTYVYTS